MKLLNEFIQQPPSPPGPTNDFAPRNDGQRDWNPDVQDIKDKNSEQIITASKELLSAIDKMEAIVSIKEDNTHQWDTLATALDNLKTALDEISIEFPGIGSVPQQTLTKNQDPTNM